MNTGGGVGNGVGLPDQAGGLVSLKEVMEDNKLNWEGFEKFGTVQEILEHNKCVHAASLVCLQVFLCLLAQRSHSQQ